jgi:thymidine phosphorylase
MPAMTSVADIIGAKRDGLALSDLQIRTLVEGVSDHSLGDGQLGAFLMAVFLRGMNDAEQVALTLAMRDSGTVLSWQGLDGPVLDKHSTGGVGDLVSLVLAPLVAACGGYVPMISGRGLGHTGGTLDKLESIPGFEVNPPLETMRRIVAQAGFAMVGQGPDLAPADHRMYAVRDVTATVSSIPLIASSILSKKLAEGLDALVMDIKTGNGAFMTDPAQARRLAEDITRIASDAGLQASALLTDMDQPLASNAGNALEMREALDWLRGRPCNARLQAVTLALAGELLQLGGLADSPADAEQKLQQALDSGRAAERFARMVALQGGPADLLERPAEYLPAAPVVVAVPAPHRPRQIGRLRRAKESESVRQHLQHPVAEDRLALLGPVLEQRENQFLLAQSVCPLDLVGVRHFEQLADVECFELR